MMKTLVGLVLVIALMVFLSFGTLSPCGLLRQNLREQDQLAAVLPDSVLDVALAAQYGSLTPGRCLNVLLQNKRAHVEVQATPQPRR
jgi:hypothetical protein